jgi:fructosamine-3-kinase
MSAGALAQRGAALLGGTLAHSEALEGGDLSSVLRITLADGRSAVVKGGAAPRAEAAMLAAMAASGAPVPAVLAVDDGALVLQPLAGGSGVNGAWGDLGGILARLHATSGPRYGWHEDYAFAGVAIENGWCADWPDFWARRRLLACAPHVPAATAARLEKLARDLPYRLPAHPTPSLLHGDLWGGNVMSAGVRITGLIDPACYYGHGEVDIAMLGMFDHPGAAFFHAYGALPPGAATRLAIYRLWPALVHLRLFGTGYRGMVETLLDEAQV